MNESMTKIGSYTHVIIHIYMYMYMLQWKLYSIESNYFFMNSPGGISYISSSLHSSGGSSSGGGGGGGDVPPPIPIPCCKISSGMSYTSPPSS